MKRTLITLLLSLMISSVFSQLNLSEHMLINGNVISFDNSDVVATINHVEGDNYDIVVGKQHIATSITDIGNGTKLCTLEGLISYKVDVNNYVSDIQILSRNQTFQQCMQHCLDVCQSSWSCSIVCLGGYSIGCIAGWSLGCATGAIHAYNYYIKENRSTILRFSKIFTLPYSSINPSASSLAIS